MSECDRYLEMISQLVDGELLEPQKTELLAHLNGCANCRRVYDAFNAISLSLGETAAPEGFAEGVMAAVRTQGGHGSRRAKKPGKSQVRYMALAACIVLAVLATVRLALPSESTGAASRRAPGGAVRHRRSSRRDRPSQFRRRCRLRGAGPLPRRGDLSARGANRQMSRADGAANGVLERRRGRNSRRGAVRSLRGAAVQLDAEQITSIEISSPDGDTTVTDEDGIGLIAALLSPSGQAQSWKALGEASYSVDINYAGGSARLDVYVADGSLVCITDGGGAYSAAAPPPNFWTPSIDAECDFFPLTLPIGQIEGVFV